MEKQQLKEMIASFEDKINQFEVNKTEKDEAKTVFGTIYTPRIITDFMVSKILSHYLIDFFNFKKQKSFNQLLNDIRQNQNLKKNLIDELPKLKILDPACGSGRFLITIAEKLFKIYNCFDLKLKNYEIKKAIIEKNLFGVDIEHKAIKISRLRLYKWLLSDLEISDEKKVEIDGISKDFEKFSLNDNLLVCDFLLEFNRKNFDIIVGNPPYIENKKIDHKKYKERLRKRFISAYRLFDISILFLEKAIELLKKRKGFLSFLTTNKFLSADYGKKIREILVNGVEVKDIMDLSSLPVFNGTSAYPIIFTIKNKKPVKNIIEIMKLTDLNNFNKSNVIQINKFFQEDITLLPAKVIPLSENVDFVKNLYKKHKRMSEVIPDLKIIYRPFGFIKWSKNFKYVSERKSSNRDLILLGTGNVGKFHINFKKPIRIAQNKIKVSYFNYNQRFKPFWENLREEKLIFREIAKSLTFVYDPGIFTNITGLYFIRIPSYNTKQLLSLLVILNSNLINLVFKALFSTLHMAGNYLRINASFVKRLPIPKKITIDISGLGKILQFLHQLKSDLLVIKQYDPFFENKKTILENMLSFFKNLSDSIVNIMYGGNKFPKTFEAIINTINKLHNFQPKFFLPKYIVPKKVKFQLKEVKSIFNKIVDNYQNFSINEEISKQISYFNQQLLV